MLQLYNFKHTWSGVVYSVNLSPHLKINQLKNIINNHIKNNLRVDDNYKIIISGQHLGELADPINLDSTNILNSLNCSSFYIRPNNEEILQSIRERRDFVIQNPNENLNVYNCCICFEDYTLNEEYSQNPLRWNNCTHYTSCCHNCIANWTNRHTVNHITTCPICRQNI